MSQSKKRPQTIDYIPTDDDGYSEDAYIAPKELVHNAVRFTYRPTPVEERALMIDVNRSVDERRFAVHCSKFLASRIIRWDIVENTPNGSVPMPLTVDNVIRLKPALWMRLVNIVIWGTEGGDPDPEWEATKATSDAEVLLEAVLAGKNRADAKLEAQQKN